MKPDTPAVQSERVQKSAQETVGDMKLSDDGRKLLRPDLTGVEFFDQLVKAKLFSDAVRLIARVMTTKEAVWWGVLCVWTTARPRPAAPTDGAVRAVMTWLREPTDANRRAAGKAGTAAGATTPIGLVATAALMADGSLTPAGQPEVKPDPNLPATLVAEAVLALSRTAGAATPGGPLLRQFLAIAVDVFHGTNKPTAKT